MVELAWHDTACVAVVNAVRNPRTPILQTVHPTLDGPSWHSLSVAQSIRHLGCRIELCRQAFHLESVQQLLLVDDSVRNVLCGLYRLWEEDEEEGPHLDGPFAGPAGAAAAAGVEVEQDPLLVMERVGDNLDCLFLRLRANPFLFLSAARGTHHQCVST